MNYEQTLYFKSEGGVKPRRAGISCDSNVHLFVHCCVFVAERLNNDCVAWMIGQWFRRLPIRCRGFYQFLSLKWYVDRLKSSQDHISSSFKTQIQCEKNMRATNTEFLPIFDFMWTHRFKNLNSGRTLSCVDISFLVQSSITVGFEIICNGCI